MFRPETVEDIAFIEDAIARILASAADAAGLGVDCDAEAEAEAMHVRRFVDAVVDQVIAHIVTA